MKTVEEAQREVHAALSDYLDPEEGEILIRWVVIIDAMDKDGRRYMAQRQGGGMDGSQSPEPWEVVGLLEGGKFLVEETIRARSGTSDQPSENDDDD